MPYFKLRKLSIIFAGTVMALCGLMFVITTIEAADSRQLLEEFLADVNLDDGVDAGEANGIAWAYFLSYVGACGGPNQGTLVGGEWVVPVAFGYGGKPMDSPIRINAATGAVSQVGGPSFQSYRSFRFSALWGIPIRQLASRLED